MWLNRLYACQHAVQRPLRTRAARGMHVRQSPSVASAAAQPCSRRAWRRLKLIGHALARCTLLLRPSSAVAVRRATSGQRAVRWGRAGARGRHASGYYSCLFAASPVRSRAVAPGAPIAIAGLLPGVVLCLHHLAPHSERAAPRLIIDQIILLVFAPHRRERARVAVCVCQAKSMRDQRCVAGLAMRGWR